ncbi:snaclec A11-like isoform X1 [Thunnus thynnus]|uniref:snaclec A11-like isoform X1 n=2 Tax=Thunnus thynnus TaxID=8237 RepID=UPI0035276F17
MVGVSFGLLCIIQTALNVSFRLQATESCNRNKTISTGSFNLMSDGDNNALIFERDRLLQEKEQLFQEKNQLAKEKKELQDNNKMLNERVNEQHNLIEQLQTIKKTGQDPSCPRGWWQYMSHCYQLSSTKKSWNYCKKDCASKGAQLVILNDELEEGVFQHYGSSTMWIGLSSQQKWPQKTWTWVDGSQLTYRNKKNGLQSDGELLNCVYAQQFPEINWVPASCEEQHNWVCERDLK